MKISKLFHWLYAILMLLPFLVFLPNAFYYGFNEHAVAQERTNYETKQVYFNQLIQQRTYEITTSAGTWTNIDQYNINFNTTHKYVLSYTCNISENGGLRTRLPIIETSKNGYNCHYISNILGDNIIYQVMSTDGNNCTVSITYENLFDLTLMYGEGNEPILEDFKRDFPLQYYKYNSGQYIEIPDYSRPYNTNMSITDSMSYAWDSVWQNDLFSWSYGSFLTEPFIYIGNVFNVPVDNSLYYALSYWLDISIIWLCFDVIMYVPLLVHRWLDKGIVE